MSSENLHKFLERLIKDVSKIDDDFRIRIANRQEHAFSISKFRLLNQTVLELKGRGIKISDRQYRLLSIEAQKTFTAIKQELQKDIVKYEAKYKLSRHPLTKFTPVTATVIYETVEGHSPDLFNRVKKRYEKYLDIYFSVVHSIFLDQNEKLPIKRGDFFHAGHAQDRGVFEFNVTTAINKALEKLNDPKIADFIIKSRRRAAVNLRAIMSKDARNMQIYIESARANKADVKQVKENKAKFIAAAKSAMDKLTKGKNFAYFEGSDSPIKASSKRVTKAVTDPFKKIKGVKVTVGDTKVKSGGSASLKITQKISGRHIPAAKSERTRKAKRPNVTSIAAILPEINAKLHDVIQSKMGVAGVDNTDGPLVYRTGTFARSVKAVGAEITPKGYADILFKFQPFPYNIFTIGGSLHTTSRDPVILIDQSIREIVAGRFGERFYTRRTY